MKDGVEYFSKQEICVGPIDDFSWQANVRKSVGFVRHDCAIDTVMTLLEIMIMKCITSIDKKFFEFFLFGHFIIILIILMNMLIFYVMTENAIGK